MLPPVSEIKIFPEPLEGIVDIAITPYSRGGRLHWHGSYWPAKFYDSNYGQPILPGQTVLVIGMQGITALVAPIPE